MKRSLSQFEMRVLYTIQTLQKGDWGAKASEVLKVIRQDEGSKTYGEIKNTLARLVKLNLIKEQKFSNAAILERDRTLYYLPEKEESGGDRSLQTDQ